MKKTLLIATALTTSAYTFSSVAAQPSSSVLQSLPAEVQKEIEDVRARCREYLLAAHTKYEPDPPEPSWGPTPTTTPSTTVPPGVPIPGAPSTPTQPPIPALTTPATPAPTPEPTVPAPQTSTAPAWDPISSGDEHLIPFTVSGMQAVMVSDLKLCGDECFPGANCTNRGSYGVAIYVRSINGTWRKALSTDARRSVFLSTDNNKFKALVLSVAGGNKDCPTRDVREGKEIVFPAWKQSCDAVVRWNGTKFTYKPL